ncbi:uncharacterized protein BP01DRAFT_86324 [Aspergillus saccharolyticus JOP 1030-1]|uniref:Uncharacterized protein n=1 Tax=Aspergillus saccharolyticus JOP 1030-1 TaxID=1450539 RepID=A0A318ZA22_9EURO|nr:hypothetical protein BP01DRAFT_86324 [Aspergillus saccharolyticus JOP 1030-1]PYH44275.1 hypothetical protein BP01DRAFT_86324 [Aspergillus saccharolyticus JOP 1030-1]
MPTIFRSNGSPSPSPGFPTPSPPFPLSLPRPFSVGSALVPSFVFFFFFFFFSFLPFFSFFPFFFFLHAHSIFFSRFSSLFRTRDSYSLPQPPPSLPQPALTVGKT